MSELPRSAAADSGQVPPRPSTAIGCCDGNMRERRKRWRSELGWWKRGPFRPAIDVLFSNVSFSPGDQIPPTRPGQRRKLEYMLRMKRATGSASRGVSCGGVETPPFHPNWRSAPRLFRRSSLGPLRRTRDKFSSDPLKCLLLPQTVSAISGLSNTMR